MTKAYFDQTSMGIALAVCVRYVCREGMSTSFTPKILPLDHPFRYASLHSGACCWPHPRRRGQSSWCRLGWNIRGCRERGVANLSQSTSVKNGCFLKSAIPLCLSHYFGSQISLIKIITKIITRMYIHISMPPKITRSRACC